MSKQEGERQVNLYSNHLKVALVGLPNSGKSSLFNILLDSMRAATENFLFSTTEAQYGSVEVPDEKFDKVAERLFLIPDHLYISLTDTRGIIEEVRESYDEVDNNLSPTGSVGVSRNGSRNPESSAYPSSPLTVPMSPQPKDAKIKKVVKEAVVASKTFANVSLSSLEAGSSLSIASGLTNMQIERSDTVGTTGSSPSKTQRSEIVVVPKDAPDNDLWDKLHHVDVMVNLTRKYASNNIPHYYEEIDPLRDIAIVDQELLVADAIQIEKHIYALEMEIRNRRDMDQQCGSMLIFEYMTTLRAWKCVTGQKRTYRLFLTDQEEKDHMQQLARDKARGRSPKNKSPGRSQRGNVTSRSTVTARTMNTARSINSVSLASEKPASPSPEKPATYGMLEEKNKKAMYKAEVMARIDELMDTFDPVPVPCTGDPIRLFHWDEHEKFYLRPLQLLTAKSVVYAVNIAERDYLRYLLSLPSFDTGATNFRHDTSDDINPQQIQSIESIHLNNQTNAEQRLENDVKESHSLHRGAVTTVSEEDTKYSGKITSAYSWTSENKGSPLSMNVSGFACDSLNELETSSSSILPAIAGAVPSTRDPGNAARDSMTHVSGDAGADTLLARRSMNRVLRVDTDGSGRRAIQVDTEESEESNDGPPHSPDRLSIHAKSRRSELKVMQRSSADRQLKDDMIALGFYGSEGSRRGSKNGEHGYDMAQGMDLDDMMDDEEAEELEKEGCEVDCLSALESIQNAVVSKECAPAQLQKKEMELRRLKMNKSLFEEREQMYRIIELDSDFDPPSETVAISLAFEDKLMAMRHIPVRDDYKDPKYNTKKLNKKLGFIASKKNKLAPGLGAGGMSQEVPDISMLEEYLRAHPMHKSALVELYNSMIRSLGLLRFYTIDEPTSKGSLGVMRCWLLRKGSTLFQAATVVDTFTSRYLAHGEVIHIDDVTAEKVDEAIWKTGGVTHAQTSKDTYSPFKSSMHESELSARGGMASSRSTSSPQRPAPSRGATGMNILRILDGMRIQGMKYVINDGDIINFVINKKKVAQASSPVKKY